MVQTRGQCLCGNVSFEINGTPVGQAQCHCKTCQRISGAGHTNNAFFKKADVTITGDTKFTPYETINGSTRNLHFCGTCGSQLFTKKSEPTSVIGIHVGTLDDNSWFTPEVAYFSKDRPAWDCISAGVEQKDEM